MVFKYGNIYEDIGCQHQFVNLCFLKLHGCRNFYFLIIILCIGRNNLCSACFGSSFYSRVTVSVYPVVASMVKNVYILCSCPETMLDYPFNQIRIRVGSQLGNNIPANIGFYQNLLAFCNEHPHSAEFLNSQIKHGSRFTPH